MPSRREEDRALTLSRGADETGPTPQSEDSLKSSDEGAHGLAAWEGAAETGDSPSFLENLGSQSEAQSEHVLDGRNGSFQIGEEAGKEPIIKLPQKLAGGGAV
jgi:hypothetical protein